MGSSSKPAGTQGATANARRRLVVLALVGIGVSSMVAVGRSNPAGSGSAVSIALVGDIMLGRGVAPIAAADPVGMFEDSRMVLRRADLAMGNLESPLTTRAHSSPTPHALEADPATARLLASAGFDVMSLANNHAGDAGPEGLLDTITAVRGAQMVPVGAGENPTAAGAAVHMEAEDLEVAVLAFDLAGTGLAAGAGPGVAGWDPATARQLVEEAAGRSDLLIVSIHGGVENLTEPDPRIGEVAAGLVAWGADVVWGHGPHVVQPVTTTPGRDRRTSVVATSLGNLLFDQRGPLNGQGAVLEVRAGPEGVVAYRVGSTTHHDLRVHFEGWRLPEGNAVLLDGEWWNLVSEPEVSAQTAPRLGTFSWGEVVSAAVGNITGEGDEVVVSFRHVPGPHPVRLGLADIDWVDARGLSPHLGIYRADDLTPIWVAGMVPAPVARVAACDGEIAMAYSTLDGAEIVGTGAANWRQFGLQAADRLPGPGTPACADVDGDGLLESVVIGRR
jgi:poly-gamma-glutamate capsule biosynthesis protein CapA/YwtB (metallophosphatase superfamily)